MVIDYPTQKYESHLRKLASIINTPDCDWPRVRELQDEAAEMFASANGWKLSHTNFSASALRDCKVHDREIHACFDMMDHPYFYRTADRRAVCIVSHLYDRSPDRINSFASDSGLIAHVAPDEMSWYFPGWATPVAYTRPGTSVAWPWDEPLPVGTFAEPVKRVPGVVV